MRKKNSRLLQGGTTDVFKERLGWWERRTDIERDVITDREFTVTKEYEHKPHLIAKVLLGREDLDWLILQYNNIVDVMEEIVVGRTLLCPSRGRVNFDITVKPTVSERL